MDKPMSEWTAEDWGRAAVALPGWRWMPGMAFIDTVISKPTPARVVGVTSRVDEDALWERAAPDVHAAVLPLLPEGARLARAPYNGAPLFYGYVEGAEHKDGPWMASCRGSSTEWFPDPDDPGSEGCLLRLLLGPIAVTFQIHQYARTFNVQADRITVSQTHDARVWEVRAHGVDPDLPHHGWSKPLAASPALGRACIAAAIAIGRWPGGEE